MTKPVRMTAAAIKKVKEIMESQDPKPAAVRLGVRGGGCSGFSYSMQFELEKGAMDKEYDFDGLKVLVDGVSAMYLDGIVIDFVSLMVDGQSGFKFLNPNVKSTCGCGSSFSA